MNRATAFAEWLGVDSAAAAMLDELYTLKGLTVRHEHLCRRLDCTLAALRTRALDLHQAMDPRSLVAIWAVGYRLTPIGVADCDRALSDAAQRDTAA